MATPIRVTTLGTGTAMPEADRGPTSTLVQHGDRALLVDAGSGTLQKLCAAGSHPLSVDALLLSHVHLDHIADVIPLLFALWIPHYDRAAPLDIVCSPGTAAVLRKVQDAFGGWLTPRDGQVRWTEVEPGQSLELGGLVVDTFAVVHDPTSVGYRFTRPEDGAVVVIPGDSGPCESLVAGCRDADLCVLECSMSDEAELDGHLTPTTYADVVRRAGIKHAVVTHRYPSARALDLVELIGRSCDATLSIADDMQAFDLP